MSNLVAPLSVIVIVAPAGRKRENLAALADSVGDSVFVLTAETCSQVEEFLPPHLPTLLLVDYRSPDKDINQQIKYLQRCSPRAHIILLRNRLHQGSPLSHLNLREALYNDISQETLQHLLTEAAKGGYRS